MPFMCRAVDRNGRDFGMWKKYLQKRAFVSGCYTCLFRRIFSLAQSHINWQFAAFESSQKPPRTCILTHLATQVAKDPTWLRKKVDLDIRDNNGSVKMMPMSAWVSSFSGAYVCARYTDARTDGHLCTTPRPSTGANRDFKNSVGVQHAN